MEKLEVRVTFEQLKATVDFKGVWTRSKIDSAYRSMLNALPAHIARLKSKGVGENKPVKEQSK